MWKIITGISSKFCFQHFDQKSCSSCEMHFLPRPGGSDEDDGVLVTIVFDGPKEQVEMDDGHADKIGENHKIIIALENDFFKELLASAGCKNLPTD